MEINLDRNLLKEHHYKVINNTFDSLTRVDMHSQQIFSENNFEEEFIDSGPSQQQQLQDSVKSIVSQELGLFRKEVGLEDLAEKYGMGRTARAELFV